MLNVALPKGRLGNQVYDLLEKAGCECPGIREESRRLLFDSADGSIRCFWVKPSDVSVYVERGAADLGQVGAGVQVGAGGRPQAPPGAPAPHGAPFPAPAARAGGPVKPRQPR